MTTTLLLAAVVIIACVVCNKISDRTGVPVLLVFILLGMFFGSDGVVKIPFDNYQFSEQVCSVALIFIMFYGGFGTNWNQAKSVAAKAIILSSAGTVVTAGLVGLFCCYVLKIELFESLLIGSVISSTDAASVFSILRSKRLNLRYNTASLLEIESGSNDPFSYMLTVITLSLMNCGSFEMRFIPMIAAQVGYGLLFGVGVAALSYFFLKKVNVTAAGSSAIFIVAAALTSYAAPSLLGGNGYLSAYITGIILGNSRISHKLELVHFFDGVTGLMQMLLFFLLGLLSFPSHLPAISHTALSIALFLTFAARPAAVFALLAPFRCSLRQMLIVSWAGMRGAASIVFSILVMIDPVAKGHDIFHIVFFIVLFSILLQGTLLPFFSRKLGMIDVAGGSSNVMRTFNDYMEEIPVQFLQFTLKEGHSWVGKALSNIILPPDSLIVLMARDGKKFIPDGKTVLMSGDTIILSGGSTDYTDSLRLYERKIGTDSAWAGRKIAEISSKADFILLIKRSDDIIIPRGSTRILEGDILVLADKGRLASA